MSRNLIFFLVSTGTANILDCCSKASFNGRTFERSGSMRMGVEKNTEVPMYISVGGSDNNGNYMQLAWEQSEKVYPVINESKTVMINNQSTIMLEEIGSGEKKDVETVTCPDKLAWTSGAGAESSWTCLAENLDECYDQLATCPTVAPKQKCQTLGRICCKTCAEWKKQQALLPPMEIAMETTQMTTITTKNIDAVDENELAEDLDSFGDKLKLLKADESQVEQAEPTENPTEILTEPAVADTNTTTVSSTTIASNTTQSSPSESTTSDATTPSIILALFAFIFCSF